MIIDKKQYRQQRLDDCQFIVGDFLEYVYLSSLIEQQIAMKTSRNIFSIHTNHFAKSNSYNSESKVTRNNSTYTSRNNREKLNEESMRQSFIKSSKPNSAIINSRNRNLTPQNFITDLNPNDILQYQPQSSRYQQRRKSCYLSRKYIQKKLLDRYMDDVFEKMSMVRKTEEKSRNIFFQEKTSRSMNRTAR